MVIRHADSLGDFKLSPSEKRQAGELALLPAFSLFIRRNSCAGYFTIFWQNRVRITAACARVAEPPGVKVVSLVPETRIHQKCVARRQAQ